MISICMAIYNKDGKYSKYTATTIASIVENTKKKICFYLLCDSTLSNDERKKIKAIVKRNKSDIVFIDVNINDFDMDFINLSRFTIGTLYRMKMLELLPEDIDRILYLDSDLIVEMDIDELWNIDLKGNAIAGALERAEGDLMDDARYGVLDDGLVEEKFYINAGVMIMDLRKISSLCNLYDDGMRFIRNHPMYLNDQDAINYLLKNSVLVIDKKYNYYSVRSRYEKEQDKKKIYHFAGDCPRDISDYYVDKLFFKYYKKTGWCDEESFINHYRCRVMEKDYEKEKMLKMLSAVQKPGVKVVFWGIGGAPHNKIMSFFALNHNSYFVDVKQISGVSHHMDREVKPPECLVDEDDKNTVIISTINRYTEVIRMAKKWGFTDNVNLFDGRLLLTEEEQMCTYGNRDCKWDM